MKARLLAAALALAAPLTLPAAAETPNPSGRTMADVLARLETFAVSEMATEKIPGMAYAVVKDGQVVFAKGYGKRKITDPADTVTPDTLFQIGSTTKAFTSALVAMQVDAGKISWDDRVVSLLPDFKMYDPWVTQEFRVCDLMGQRGGMPGYALDVMSRIGFGRADIQRSMRFVEPTYSFRNGYAYVNNLWLTAARIVEKEEGMTWEEALAARIFQPLGMRDSTVDPELVKLVADRATGHYKDAGGWTPVPDDTPFLDWLDVYGPAGNIRSTIGDMSKWAAFHLAHGKVGTTTLLQAATVDALHAPRTYVANPPASAAAPAPPSTAYGLGWIHQEYRNGTLVWHNGGTTGQHSLIGLYELPNVALVVLTNAGGNDVPEKMSIQLLDLLCQIPGNPPTAAAPVVIDHHPAPPIHRRPLASIPPLPLERYVGAYENPGYGRFTVQLESGKLVMLMGPRQVKGTLDPWSGNTFVMTAPVELPPIEVPVTFTVPTGQNAAKLVFEGAFADVRGGVFSRTN